MKTIGIITIHRIHNYGSVLQAYALQQVCERLGYKVEIIDYVFPNAYQQGNKYAETVDAQPNEPRWIKALFAHGLIRQHKGIDSFIEKKLHLSQRTYSSPQNLLDDPPIYDVYMTGSDQVWSPRHCNGDPSFMLHFAPEGAKRVSYASSIGSDMIPDSLRMIYENLLSKYQCLSVREKSGIEIINNLTDKDVQVVLDPTLLLDYNEWNRIAAPNRLVKKKYILCYLLNYSFNAFPYVDQLAKKIQHKTGYELVRVARPPHHLYLRHTKYCIGASPEEFLALVRDAEMVLTTSFHGTAYALNFGKPVYTVVKDRNAGDSRQKDLMKALGLDDKVMSIKDAFPSVDAIYYDVRDEQEKLAALRNQSIEYLKKALR